MCICVYIYVNKNMYIYIYKYEGGPLHIMHGDSNIRGCWNNASLTSFNWRLVLVGCFYLQMQCNQPYFFWKPLWHRSVASCWLYVPRKSKLPLHRHDPFSCRCLLGVPQCLVCSSTHGQDRVPANVDCAVGCVSVCLLASASPPHPKGADLIHTT